jgi:hypothetical protein
MLISTTARPRFSGHSSVWRALLPLTACGLFFLTGCSSASGADANQPATGGGTAGEFDAAKAGDEVTAHYSQWQNLIADCMKNQGFQYLPVTPPAVAKPDLFGGKLSVLQPADEVRRFRQKYGFGGAYALLMYPQDKALAGYKSGKVAENDPNDDIRAALDPARRRAFDLALQGATSEPGPTYTPTTGCVGEMRKKSYPGEDTVDATTQAYSAFQAQPAVVAAAQKYADCLRKKGYAVNSAKPGAIESELAEQAWSQQVPASVSKADAQAALQKEIETALADLDCRTDYAALVRTKYAKVVFENGNS